MKLNILCIGDVVGRPGKHVLAGRLSSLVKEREIDCVIVNAENIAGGSGITPQIYEKLLKYGVSIITLGDHAYRKREIISVLERSSQIVRPANFSPSAPGKGFTTYKTHKGTTIGVVALIGRLFMKPADSPYDCIDAILPKLKNFADIIFVDMHAEATSEKVVMGYHLDGRVSCVFGTHTHIVTADEKILPRGTAYITDIGMTGAHDSVLGRNVDSVLKHFRTQQPCSFGIATHDVRLDGIIVTVDSNSKRAERIERVQIFDDAEDGQAYDNDEGRGESFNGF